jgi:hypothetical protein
MYGIEMKKPLWFIQNETILEEYGNTFSKPTEKKFQYSEKKETKNKRKSGHLDLSYIGFQTEY